MSQTSIPLSTNINLSSCATLPLSASSPITNSSYSQRRALNTDAPPSMPSRTSSFSFVDDELDTVTLDGLRHANIRLDARQYKSPIFSAQLLAILILLHVPSWRKFDIPAKTLKIHKVSGSLTNAVFFVSCPELDVPTLLLRIYGPSSGELISRPKELYTLHILSSQYHIGPRVFGTFSNGRVEEYFDSVTLVPSDLRDKRISRWIGARMAELHSVDISSIEGYSASSHAEEKDWQIGVKENVRTWITPAREVLGLPSVSERDRASLDLAAFVQQWDQYMRWLAQVERVEAASRRVFAHNDAQYGNLLRLTGKLKEGIPEHRQIIVVDFEYSAPNPLAYDIANHFHEWTANYHSSAPHILDPSRYPTLEERRNFYRSYLAHSSYHPSSPTPPVPFDIPELALHQLERQVRIWSPASHGMWAMWGIVQAKDDLKRGECNPEFDYIGYAKCRMDGFRRELRDLGILQT